MFNSAHDTNTFKAETAAELYLAAQFPGQFADPRGRVQPPLQVSDKTEGGFAILVIVRQARPLEFLKEMAKLGDPFGLLSIELRRQERPPSKSEGWDFL